MRRKKELGRRMSVWIPVKDLWIFDALQNRVRILENRGIRTGIADQVKKILLVELEKDTILEVKDGEQKEIDNIPEKG